MCKECLKKITDWDRENLSPKDMFDLFGPPMPRRLCYYHRKIHDGLIDGPETDSPFPGIAIWNYRPLVHALAWKWSAQLGLEYSDVVQQGYSILAALAYKVDWEMHPNQISKYIKRSVEGYLKMYFAKSMHTVMIPHFFQIDKAKIIVEPVGYEDNTRWYTDEPNPEEQCLVKEERDIASDILDRVLQTLNEREAYVLWHHIISDEPMSMREIADQFHCGKSAIGRDVTRLVKLLQEEGKPYKTVTKGGQT